MVSSTFATTRRIESHEIQIEDCMSTIHARQDLTEWMKGLPIPTETCTAAVLIA